MGRSNQFFEVTFLPYNRSVKIREGETILDAAIEGDIPLDHACGGCCSCTTCRVEVKEPNANLAPAEEDETMLLEEDIEQMPSLRLGCQARIYSDVTVEIHD